MSDRLDYLVSALDDYLRGGKSPLEAWHKVLADYAYVYHTNDVRLPIDRASEAVFKVKESGLIVTEHKLKMAAHEVIQLVLRKNKDYGDAWQRCGIAGIMVRELDKALRLEQLEDGREALVVEEKWVDTLRDIAGYALLGLLLEGYKNNRLRDK